MRRAYGTGALVIAAMLALSATASQAQVPADLAPCLRLALSGYSVVDGKFDTPAETATFSFDIEALAEMMAVCRDARSRHPADRLALVADYKVTQLGFQILLGLTTLPQTDEDGVKTTEAMMQSGKTATDTLMAPIARIYLGKAYEHGLGTPKNLNLARQHYRAGADAGSAIAKRELAKISQ